MTDQETTQLILDILHKAQDGKAQPFRMILYWSEFSYYRKLKSSTKLIIKTLKTSATRLFKNYCKDVIAGISDLDTILAYTQLLDIISFYELELETLQSMLTEYTEYLEDGNFWYSFLGGRRDI